MLFQNLNPTRKLEKSIDFAFSSTILRNQKVLHSSNENDCEGCNAPCLLSPGRPGICRMGSPASAPESAASMNIDQTYFVCTQSSAFLTVRVVQTPELTPSIIQSEFWSSPIQTQTNIILSDSSSKEEIMPRIGFNFQTIVIYRMMTRRHMLEQNECCWGISMS